MKVPQFSSIHTLNIIWDVWPVWMWPPCLFACVMVYQPHPCIHWWIESGINIYIDYCRSWYITQSKAEDESAPVFIYPPMVYHVGIVWPVWMWSHCLVDCVMVYSPHSCTYWWIEMGVKICTYSWSSWYITHHQQKQNLKMCQFSFLHVHPSFGCCVTSMDVIPLFGCLYNGVSTSPMYPKMDWRRFQHLYG